MQRPGDGSCTVLLWRAPCMQHPAWILHQANALSACMHHPGLDIPPVLMHRVICMDICMDSRLDILLCECTKCFACNIPRCGYSPLQMNQIFCIQRGQAWILHHINASSLLRATFRGWILHRVNAPSTLHVTSQGWLLPRANASLILHAKPRSWIFPPVQITPSASHASSPAR